MYYEQEQAEHNKEFEIQLRLKRFFSNLENVDQVRQTKQGLTAPGVQ